MNDNHAPGTCPTDPTYPDVGNVPCENHVRHGENVGSGYIGHVGYIPEESTLLSGLFVDEVPSMIPVVPFESRELRDATERCQTALDCGFCGSANLLDESTGLRCDDCGHLAWLDADGDLIRVHWHDHDIGSMAPDDLPTCSSCDDLCDTQTVDGRWRCSRCDPRATQRRKRTARLIQDAERIRNHPGALDN